MDFKYETLTLKEKNVKYIIKAGTPVERRTERHNEFKWESFTTTRDVCYTIDDLVRTIYRVYWFRVPDKTWNIIRVKADYIKFE